MVQAVKPTMLILATALLAFSAAAQQETSDTACYTFLEKRPSDEILGGPRSTARLLDCSTARLLDCSTARLLDCPTG